MCVCVEGGEVGKDDMASNVKTPHSHSGNTNQQVRNQGFLQEFCVGMGKGGGWMMCYSWRLV